MKRILAAAAFALALLVAVLAWHIASRSGSTSRSGDDAAADVAAKRPPSLAAAPGISMPGTSTPGAGTSEAPGSGKSGSAAPAPHASPPRVGKVALHRVDGFSLVHIGGGEPAIKPFGGRGHEPTRRITGRVVDAAGHPLPGVAVLADTAHHVERQSLMSLGGAATDASGAFEIDDAPAGTCTVVALDGDDWSDIVTTTSDAPIELHMRGHGSLTVHATYDGGPETFVVHLTLAGAAFAVREQTGADGQLHLASLPAGTYSVSAGLAETLGGGQTRYAAKTVEIAAGSEASVDLALSRGTTVAVTAVPPADTKPRGITYWLFTGTAPADGTAAAARKTAEDAPSSTMGAGLRNDPMQFHDVSPGTYSACAAFFDVSTMGVFAHPFGCTQVTVADGDDVREVTVDLH